MNQKDVLVGCAVHRSAGNRARGVICPGEGISGGGTVVEDVANPLPGGRLVRYGPPWGLHGVVHQDLDMRAVEAEDPLPECGIGYVGLECRVGYGDPGGNGKLARVCDVGTFEQPARALHFMTVRIRRWSAHLPRVHATF